MIKDEGYIKFNLDWKKSNDLIPIELFNEINKYRTSLHQLQLIGVYPDGIGFGNISIKPDGDEHFYITGTSTGHIQNLEREHYTKVTYFDLKSNMCKCEGPIKASSESMTHGIIYTLDKEIHGVIHIHNLPLWEKLKYKVPTTSESATFGTVEIAKEVEHLYAHSDLKQKQILVMAGHEEGIISFGKNLNEAMQILSVYID